MEWKRFSRTQPSPVSNTGLTTGLSTKKDALALIWSVCVCVCVVHILCVCIVYVVCILCLCGVCIFCVYVVCILCVWYVYFVCVCGICDVCFVCVCVCVFFVCVFGVTSKGKGREELERADNFTKVWFGHLWLTNCISEWTLTRKSCWGSGYIFFLGFPSWTFLIWNALDHKCLQFHILGYMHTHGT